MTVHVPSLVHTAFAGDVSGVESLIGSGIDVNQSRGPRGTTALHAATYMNHVGVVSLLLKHGANVHIRDGGQWTALHIASSKGFLPIIEALIANGSQLTAVLDVGGKMWNATTLFGTSKHISPPLTTEEIQQGRAVMWHARHSYEDAHTHTQLKRVFGLCLCGFNGSVKGIAPESHDARPVACSHGVAAGQVAPDPAHHHHAPILGTSPDQHYDQHHHHAPILGSSPHLHKDGHDLHSPVFGDEQDKKLVELSQTAPAPEPTHHHQHKHQDQHQHLETSPTSSSTTTRAAAAAAAVAAVAAEMAAEASAKTRAAAAAPAAPAAAAAAGGAFSLGALFGWGRHKTAPPPQEQEEEQQSEYVDDYGWISVK